MTKLKLKITMGGVLAAAGLWLRALQIFFIAFGVKAAADSILTLVVTCIAVGGFCVMAVERRGAAAILSLTAALLTLCGVMSAGNLRLLGTAAMLLNFAVLALLMFVLPKNRVRLAIGVLAAILFAAVLLHTVGAVTMPRILISVILFLIYGASGAGLIL